MSDSSNDGCGTVVMATLVMFGLACVSAAISKDATDDAWRDILVKRGVAEYYLDANNVRQWHFKEEIKQ